MEIGVWRGGTGALLATRMKEMMLDTKLYLWDTFEGVVKTSDVDDSKYYCDGMHSDTSIREVENLLSILDLDNCEINVGIFPDDASSIFQDMKYRFVHIDVDIYLSAKGIFNFVWERMVPGGIVVFDDYGFICTKGVTKLCEELRDVKDGIFCTNLNGHGYFIKK